MEWEIIPRSDAIGRGLKQYFTGKPCKNGHIDKRATVNSTCRSCGAESLNRTKAKDHEGWKRKHKVRCERHIAKHPDFHAAVYARHRDKIQARVRRYLEQNPHYKNAVNQRRKLRIATATPHWLTAKQRRELVRIYEEAAARPGGPWHVDHIVPIQGRNVCGLHVPWNLQIITKAENLRKGAALIADDQA